jgi:hypothetical protein
MTEDNLIELGFKRIDVPVEESGDKEDYHYYNYKLSDDINLVSSDSTESGKRNWVVSVDYWGRMENVDDVSMIIDFFKRISK